MSIATDVRNYADLALEQGKTALTQAASVVTTANKRLVADAPKPAYAALGAADLVAATVTKRIEALPSGAVANASKAQEGGKALFGKAQQDAVTRVSELRERIDAGIGTVKSIQTRPLVKLTTEVYLDTAKRLYGQLTARGEARAAELLNDSRLSRVIGDVGDATGAVRSRVAPVIGSVQDDVVPLARSAFDTARNIAADVEPEAVVRSTPTRKSTATKRTAAKSVPAKSAPVKSTAAKRAAAAKTSPAKSTTAKSTTRRTAKKAPAKAGHTTAHNA